MHKCTNVPWGYYVPPHGANKRALVQSRLLCNSGTGISMTAMAEHRITWHLDNWAYWQRNIATDFGEGFSFKDGSGACSVSSREFQSMVDDVDRRCADAVSAVLESVTPMEFAAVRHKHLEAVWRSGRDVLEEAYQRARIAVMRGLVKRGID